MKQTIANLITNWKTTSAGLSMIIGSGVHLIFAVQRGTANENTWTTSLLAIITGIGLLAAGDAGKSATKDELKEVKDATLLNSTAIKTGDTSMLVNPALTKPADASTTPKP